MPRLLHLIPTFSGGGAERQLSLLVAEQAKRGWDVHIGIRRGGVHAESLHSRGVTVHLIGDHRGINPLLLSSANKLIKQIKPDIIQTWLPQMDIVGGIGALWNGIPWIISERSSKKAYLGYRLQVWLRRYLARYADAIVANSLSGVRYWHELLPADARIFRVANAVDVDTIRKVPPTKIDPSTTMKDCNTNLLVVGRLAPEKAVDVLMKAICMNSSTNSVGVRIIGEGPMREDIENMIKEMDLDDRVSLLSYRQDWWGLLRSATALVSMSRFEGQPNVVLEAMAAGCPVIVSDIPSHREILDEESAIFVQPDSPSELAKAIDSLITRPDATRSRAECASGRVESMTIQTTASEYENIIKEILSGVNN